MTQLVTSIRAFATEDFKPSMLDRVVVVAETNHFMTNIFQCVYSSGVVHFFEGGLETAEFTEIYSDGWIMSGPDDYIRYKLS